MSIYGPDNEENLTLDTELVDENAIQSLGEAYIYDEIARLPDDRRKEFCESAEAQALVERGLIGRKTLVRLSKNDDIERRIGMAAIQLAKDKNDLLYVQLIKNRSKEKELLGKINTKYAAPAIKVAKVGQRDYLHKVPKVFKRK